MLLLAPASAATRASPASCETLHVKQRLNALRALKNNPMKLLHEKIQQAGAAGYLLMWLLGIPVPVLLLIFLLRGCR